MQDSRWLVNCVHKLILLFSLLLVGCATTQSRIAQHQADFDQLPAEQREMILNSQVDFGFTPNMVYMALGAPHRKLLQKTVEGESTAWIYLKTKTEFYTIDYAGTLHCRRGRSSHSPMTGTRHVPYEAIRIRFQEAAVVSIETQVK